MAKYMRVKRVLVETDLVATDVMSLTDAARLLEKTVQGVISDLDRGKLTTVLEESASRPGRGRRRVLRSEVEDLLAQRAAGLI